MLNRPDDWQAKSDRAANYVRNRWNGSPAIGLVLGTGAGSLIDSIDIEEVIEYRDVPHFPVSTALGHAGRFVCGQLEGCRVLAMQGRFHLYEGYSVDQVSLPIRVMGCLGVKRLIVTNAAGGIKPNFSTGDIMLIESHLDLTHQGSSQSVDEVVSPRSVSRSDSYDRRLIEAVEACGRRNQFPVQRGVYAAVLGPNYETRAEYRFLKRIGVDAVGMSTIPEVGVAVQAKMRVLGLSIITNVAAPDVLIPTSGQAVIDVAKESSQRLKWIVSALLKNM